MKELMLDGHRVLYREAGEGEPAILVHGWTGSSYDWIKLIPLIAQKHRVVSPDLIGFGLSDKPRIPHRLETYTGLIAKLADALGLNRFHIVGNSMGGQIAAAFAIEHPDRLLTLALLDAAGVSPHAPALLGLGRFPGLVAFLLGRVSLPLYDFYYRKFGPYYDSSFLTPDDVRGHYHSFGNREGAYAAAQCLAQILHSPAARLDKKLHRIKLPTLIVWGKEDPQLPLAMSEVFLREIPFARRVLLDRCGHCPHEEHPELLRQILEDFWRQTKTP